MIEPVVIAPSEWPAWPERTIVDEVAAWCARWLRQPDGPEAGAPWMFTDTQLRVLAYWFAFDESDRWTYRRGTVRLMKGAGKDPLAAVLAMVELCGPCRVVDGRAVEHRSPWIQIAAVSQWQTRTTMRLFAGLVSSEARDRWAIDVNKEIIYAHGGRGVIEAVTSSPLALEGGRASLTIRNEVQNWNASNQGHEMNEVIDGNLAKSRDGAARALSLCNAHVPGEDSVGEREWDAWQAIASGRTRLRDVLYFAIEAPPETKLDDESSLRDGLSASRGDSSWLDVDRLIAEVWDPQTTPSAARRKYLNQIVASEDAWLEPHEWDRARSISRLENESEITLGFDGGKTDDWCALIATRVEDGWMVPLGIWDPSRYGDEAPRAEIDGTVRRAFETYDVVAFYSDLKEWESYVDAWERDLDDDLCVRANARHRIAWDMRARLREFTFAVEETHEAIESERLIHSGDPVLAQHAKNARRRPNQYGISIGKEHRESSRKIDAIVAGILSRLAWRDYLALPASKRRRKRSGAAAFY